MDILRKYKVYCHTEGCFIETLRRSKPIVCPTNPRHEIDPNQTIEIDQQFVESSDIQNVYISSKAYGNTNGTYRAEGLTYNIPGNVGVFIQDYTVPVQFCIFRMKLCIREEHFGDSISICVQPNTLVAVATNEVLQGATTIHIPESSIYHLISGYHIMINNEERQIVSVNKTDFTITVNSPFSEAIPVNTPIYLNMYVIKTVCLDAAGNLDIGDGAFGGKVIPAGSVLQLKYNNTTGVAKRFSFNMEYMY